MGGDLGETEWKPHSAIELSGSSCGLIPITFGQGSPEM
jgi:hypothetical protein